MQLEFTHGRRSFCFWILKSILIFDESWDCWRVLEKYLGGYPNKGKAFPPCLGHERVKASFLISWFTDPPTLISKKSEGKKIQISYFFLIPPMRHSSIVSGTNDNSA
jgi:hypothetical protein